jgi:AAA domain/Primase C terminal 1 (PriCT-1)
MRRHGATQASILQALNNENSERCKPPLSKIEVRQIANSISRYPPAKSIISAMEEKGMTAADLLKKDIPAPNWVIPGILPEGLSLLCGKRKVGKSWLTLNLWSAVSGCTDLIPGKSITRGKALYLALEDTERRLQDRLRKVIDDAQKLILASNTVGAFTDIQSILDYQNELKFYSPQEIVKGYKAFQRKRKSTVRKGGVERNE